MKKQQFLCYLILFVIPMTVRATGVSDPAEFAYLYHCEGKQENEESSEECNYEEEAERDQQLKYTLYPPLKGIDSAEIRQEQFRESTSWPGKMEDKFYGEFTQQ